VSGSTKVHQTVVQTCECDRSVIFGLFVEKDHDLVEVLSKISMRSKKTMKSMDFLRLVSEEFEIAFSKHFNVETVAVYSLC